MHSQVNNDGYEAQALDEIVDCRKDRNVVDIADMCIRIKNGQKYIRQTSSGWSLAIL